MAGVWLVNAALLAAVGKVLIEQGMKNEDVAGQIWDALPVVLPL